MPNKLLPFDDVLIVRPIYWKKSTGGVLLAQMAELAGKLPDEMKVGRVVSAGPGRLVDPVKWSARAREIQDDEAKLGLPSTVDVNAIGRLPNNAKPGQVIVFSRALPVYPDGPGGPMLLIVPNDSVLARVVDENDADPAELVEEPPVDKLKAKEAQKKAEAEAEAAAAGPIGETGPAVDLGISRPASPRLVTE